MAWQMGSMKSTIFWNMSSIYGRNFCLKREKERVRDFREAKEIPQLLTEVQEKDEERIGGDRKIFCRISAERNSVRCVSCRETGKKRCKRLKG